MTPPMTPREKVAALKTNDPTNPAHRLARDIQAGHRLGTEARDDLIEVLSEIAALRGERVRLRAAVSKSNDEICQSLGKALGYPWFKDDQANFLGSTETDGVCVGDHVAESIADEAARRLTQAERQRDELRKALSELRGEMVAARNDIGVEDWISFASEALANQGADQ